MTEVLLTLGLKQCLSDPCVFVKPGLKIGIHVDDVTVTGTTNLIKELKSNLASRMRNLHKELVDENIKIEMYSHNLGAIDLAKNEGF